MINSGKVLIEALDEMFKILLFHNYCQQSMQARCQKFVMGGCLGGLGAEPPALENVAFFCKNNFILGYFD